MNRYTVSSLIGEGSFGRVYKATRKDDVHTVAIKVISKRGRSSKELKNLRRECDIQAHLKHPNVIEMLESFETKNDLIVVTEFALIDLHRYLSRNGALSEERAQRLICHLISALYYLHSNRILHRDLKPQNVLLNEDLHAKLCDFGLARNMTMGTHVLTSIKGTPLYMAPELLAERPYDHQADLWSLGCISYESMAGQPPFCTTSILHLVKMIKHEEVKWPSFLSSDCRSLLQGLLEKDPSMRISWTQILCHPFVEGKLFIAGIKADNSPFTNPEQKKKPSKTTAASATATATAAAAETDDLQQNLAALKLTNASQCTTADNMTSSRDSMNAIPPSDIENLETDVEDNLNRVVVPFADCSYKVDAPAGPSKGAELPNLTNLMAVAVAAPVINSQTCFVSGNPNMILNHLNDNFPTTTTIITATTTTTTTAAAAAAAATDAAKGKSQVAVNAKKSTRNKDLEKRKLSQNLDNFSLRLGQSIDVETHRKTTDMLTQKGREKEKSDREPKSASLKNSAQSTDDKQSTDHNSPPCLLPGWDSCDESQSPPIENDEWLAFLHRSMQEVLDGELDSLKQHNLVSIIVAPLRNSKAIPKVVDSVAQLLSLPFVMCDHKSVIEVIKTVYVDVKLVPNLMYASKLLICQKSTNDSTASLPFHAVPHNSTRALRQLSELSVEELRTAARLYELICHLVHLRQQFLSQFCDAVAILAADELLINLLNHDFKNCNAVRISCCVLALFCCVLRELPENAELVEKIVFHPKLNLLALLANEHDLLRTRTCMLFRLLARFSLRGLQSVWCTDIKKAIERLADDGCAEVKEEAENTLEELRHFSFYG